MSKSLNDEVRQAFSKLTLPPPASLLDRIRESIWSRPAPAAPPPVVPLARVGPSGSRTAAGRRPVPGAVLVAATLVIVLAAGALLIGPGGLGRQVAGVPALIGSGKPASTAARPAASQPAQTPALAASPTEAPTPAPAATPATPAATPATPAATPAGPAPLPGYACTTQSGGGSAPSNMTAARVGAQNGYDRFVVQFSGDVPLFEVRPQDSASFTVGGSGATVSLRGSAGLRVTLRNASGAGYVGLTDFQPGFSMIQEARLLSDSGGVVQWGIGLSHASCFHAWTLAGPSRLVIDVQD